MMMDKTKVCQSVHLCKPPAGQVQLLGGKFCTFGPAYWCVSKEHAIACNVSASPFSFYFVANAIVFLFTGAGTLSDKGVDEARTLNTPVFCCAGL
jgi:hypothetical protein